jgi:hypothetical protein
MQILRTSSPSSIWKSFLVFGPPTYITFSWPSPYLHRKTHIFLKHVQLTNTDTSLFNNRTISDAPKYILFWKTSPIFERSDCRYNYHMNSQLANFVLFWSTIYFLPGHAGRLGTQAKPHPQHRIETHRRSTQQKNITAAMICNDSWSKCCHHVNVPSQWAYELRHSPSWTSVILNIFGGGGGGEFFFYTKIIAKTKKLAFCKISILCPDQGNAEMLGNGRCLDFGYTSHMPC